MHALPIGKFAGPGRMGGGHSHFREGELSAAEAAARLPSRALLSGQLDSLDNSGVSLRYHEHASASIDFDAISAHALVMHMGGCSYITDDSLAFRRRGWAEAGSMSLSPAGRPLRRFWKGRPEVLVAFLEPGSTSAIARELSGRAQEPELVPQLAVADRTLDHLGRVLLDAMANETPLDALVVESTCRAVNAHLLRRYSSLSLPTPQRPGPLPDGRLSRVTDYMHENIGEKIRLRDLAAISELSVSHFARAFRIAAGKPPHAFLAELRISRAKDLLRASRLPIAEIAEQLGYADPQHFSTMFRRRTGFTPTEWRNIARA